MKIKRLLQLMVIGIFISISGYPQSYPRNCNWNYMFTPLYEEFEDTSLSPQWHPTIHYAREIGFLVNSPSTIKVDTISKNLQLSMLNSPNYLGSVWSDSCNCFVIKTYDYIGGEINSNEEFLYGIFECKAMFAHNSGSMPAFWTLGGNGLT